MATCSSTAHASARWTGSLPEGRSPKSTMMESPMNLSMVPSCAKTTSTMAIRQRLRTLRTTSGGCRSARAVNPRTSAKRMVSSREVNPSSPSRLPLTALRSSRATASSASMPRRRPVSAETMLWMRSTVRRRSMPLGASFFLIVRGIVAYS